LVMLSTDVLQENVRVIQSVDMINPAMVTTVSLSVAMLVPELPSARQLIMLLCVAVDLTILEIL